MWKIVLPLLLVTVPRHPQTPDQTQPLPPHQPTDLNPQYSGVTAKRKLKARQPPTFLANQKYEATPVIQYIRVGRTPCARSKGNWQKKCIRRFISSQKQVRFETKTQNRPPGAQWFAAKKNRLFFWQQGFVQRASHQLSRFHTSGLLSSASPFFLAMFSSLALVGTYIWPINHTHVRTYAVAGVATGLVVVCLLS